MEVEAGYRILGTRRQCGGRRGRRDARRHRHGTGPLRPGRRNASARQDERQARGRRQRHRRRAEESDHRILQKPPRRALGAARPQPSSDSRPGHPSRHHPRRGRRPPAGLEKFGTKSFAEVAAPAIERANAFPSTEIFSNTLGMFQKIIDFWPTSQQFYFPNGTVPKPGELVHMPALAAHAARNGRRREKSARQPRRRNSTPCTTFFIKATSPTASPTSMKPTAA